MTLEEEISPLARMQAQVDKLSGLWLSGKPNRNTAELCDTGVRLNRGTSTKSSPNWHSPGRTKAFWGGPTTREFSDEKKAAEMTSLFFLRSILDRDRARGRSDMGIGQMRGGARKR